MNNIPYLERAQVYQKAIDAFGVEAQLLMCIEEMSELTKAICKFRRAKPNQIPERLHDIAEECADVTIMMEQLRIMFDSNEEVCRVMDMKVARLKERLNWFRQEVPDAEEDKPAP